MRKKKGEPQELPECPHYTERWPLHAAVIRNDLHTLERLLLHSDETIPKEPEAEKTGDGTTKTVWSSWTSWGIPADPSFNGPLCVNGINDLGHSPLHLAVLLHHFEIVQLLLLHGADPGANNIAGWTPVDDAIYCYDDAMVYLLYARSCEQASAEWHRKLPALFDQLESIPDFYFELKWDFHSYVPFLAYLLPNDKYRIWKQGSCIRFEYSLVSWRRGSSTRADMSLYLCGRDSEQPGEIIVYDHTHNRVMYALDHLRHPSHEYICEEAQNLYYAQSGTGFMDLQGLQTHPKCDKSGRAVVDTVAGHPTEQHHMAGKAVFKSRVRARQKKSEVPSLRPYVPPYPTYSWDEGLYDPTDDEDSDADHGMRDALTKEALQLGAGSASPDTEDGWDSVSSRAGSPAEWHDSLEYSLFQNHDPESLKDLYANTSVKEKVETKTVKTHLHIAPDFPVKLSHFFPILEAITPASHLFVQAKEFLDLGLPGFPLKGSLPVYHALSVRFEFTRFELRQPSEFSPSDFQLPSTDNYTAVERLHISKGQHVRERRPEAAFFHTSPPSPPSEEGATERDTPT